MKTVIVHVGICDVWLSGKTDSISNQTKRAVEPVRVVSISASIVAAAFSKVIL